MKNNGKRIKRFKSGFANAVGYDGIFFAAVDFYLYDKLFVIYNSVFDA